MLNFCYNIIVSMLSVCAAVGLNSKSTATALKLYKINLIVLIVIIFFSLKSQIQMKEQYVLFQLLLSPITTDFMSYVATN